MVVLSVNTIVPVIGAEYMYCENVVTRKLHSFFMKHKSLRDSCIKLTISSHGMFDIGALSIG